MEETYIFVYFIFQESYERAKVILQEHKKEHDLLTNALLEFETLDRDEIQVLLKKGKIAAVADLRKEKDKLEKEQKNNPNKKDGDVRGGKFLSPLS